MQNEARASIKVISSHVHEHYDQYLVEVSQDNSCHYVYLRFSELYKLFGHITYVTTDQLRLTLNSLLAATSKQHSSHS